MLEVGQGAGIAPQNVVTYITFHFEKERQRMRRFLTLTACIVLGSTAAASASNINWVTAARSTYDSTWDEIDFHLIPPGFSVGRENRLLGRHVDSTQRGIDEPDWDEHLASIPVERSHDSRLCSRWLTVLRES